MNGTQVAAQPVTGLLTASTSPLEIGGSLVDGGAFAGLIDDVRLYNTALTPAQIQTDMATGVGSDTQAPTAPTALAVLAASPTQLTVTWTASTDTVGVTGYRVERCLGAACTTFSQVGTPSTPTYSDAGLVAVTTYTYRVRATDAANNLSGYSSAVSGTTLTPPPAPTPPASPSPVSAATGVALTPPLSWAPSTNTTQYDVALGTTSSPAVVSSNQTATSYAPAALTGGTTYYWKVVAKGPGGSTSGPVWTFTTVPAPAAPASPSPTSAATSVSVTPTLSWAPSANATQYTVAFGTTTPPAVVSSTQTATSYLPAALIAGTTYYWQVVAKGTGGSTSGPVWSLTTVGPARPLPIAAYGFNEGTGTTTGDASGNGRTGALTSTTWTTAGKSGGALSFDGSASRVTVADAAALHLSAAMTLEAWVNPSTTGSPYWQALIYKGLDTYYLATLGDPSVPTAGGTGAGGPAQVTSPSALTAHAWTHLATTYDGAMLRLFVNGIQVASQPATGPLVLSTSPLEIGGSLVDGGAFTGLIDEVRIYNTALTAAQIQTDMTTPVTSTTPAATPTLPSSPLPAGTPRVF